MFTDMSDHVQTLSESQMIFQVLLANSVTLLQASYHMLQTLLICHSSREGLPAKKPSKQVRHSALSSLSIYNTVITHLYHKRQDHLSKL